MHPTPYFDKTLSGEIPLFTSKTFKLYNRHNKFVNHIVSDKGRHCSDSDPMNNNQTSCSRNACFGQMGKGEKHLCSTTGRTEGCAFLCGQNLDICLVYICHMNSTQLCCIGSFYSS